MSESSYFDGPNLFLKHATFLHLSGVEWDALNCLATKFDSVYFGFVLSVDSDTRRIERIGECLYDGPSKNQSHYLRSIYYWLLIIFGSLIINNNKLTCSM